MRRIYHLSTCSTNKAILASLPLSSDIELQDIKAQNIDAKTLDYLKEKVGSYETLFSRRAMKYKALGLDKQQLTEADFRRYLLEEYTFLKRPFIILDEEVFIGNTSRTIEEVRKTLAQKR